MGVIKRRVKENLYLYYRDKERHETYLGKEGSQEASEKLSEIQRQKILTEIKSLRTRLAKLNGYHPPSVPTKADYSKLPINQIINDDAFNVLSGLPENSIHMAITSPPYNLGLPYDLYVDEQEYSDYRDSLKKIWKETFRVLVNGGRFALNIAPTGIADFREVHHDLVADVKSIGFTLRTEILWYKQNMGKNTAWGSFASPSNPHIVPSWEYVYVFHKNTPKLEGVKADIDITSEEFQKFSDGFWRISPETKRNGHPAPFPEELIYRLIKFYTYKGNVCLDMFGGTGTVALVALKTGRKYISIDISKQYCQIAQKRLDEVVEQKKIEIA
ncbi:MAG: site-specific DNA-methyltransferase [Nitrososphaerota archaeon]|nr:site-specific DNA-methyltransferase [Nitrososphaerota archaeon]